MGRGFIKANRVDTTPALVFFLLILILPLLPIGSAFQAYLMQAAVAGIAVSVLFGWHSFQDRWSAISRNNAVRLALGLLGWASIEVLLRNSPARGSSLELAEFSRIACGTGAFIGMALLLNRTAYLRTATRWITQIGGLLALTGIATWLIGTDVRSQAFTGNPQILGALLSLFIPVAFAEVLKKSSHQRRTSIAIVASLWLALLLTGTRSSCLAAAIGSIVVLILSPGVLHRVRTKITRLDLAATVLIAVGIFCFAPANKGLLHRLMLSPNDASVADRLSVWKAAGKIVADHPMNGAGLGAFPLLVSHYSHFWQLQSPAQIAAEGVGMTNLAHNEYLQIAADMGLPALLLVVALLASCALTLLNKLKSASSKSTRTALIASLGVLTVYSLSCVANPATHFPVVSVLFWSLMGIGLAAAASRSTAPKKTRSIFQSSIQILLQRLQIPITTTAFILCVCGSLTNIGWAYPLSNLYFPGNPAAITPLLQTGTWGSNIYSAGPSTIANKGGGITTLAMALNAAGINNHGAAWDPGTLNTFMNSHSTVRNGFNIGDFSGNSVDWAATVADARSVSTNPNTLQWHGIDRSMNNNSYYAGSLLSQGYPVVINMPTYANLYYNPWQSVLVTGVSTAGTRFLANDPITGATQLPLIYYNTTMQGYVSSTSNLSEIDVSVVSNYQDTVPVLKMTDPKGLITLSNGTDGIPNSTVNTQQLAYESTGANPTDTSTMLQILQPSAGSYTFQLSGGSGAYAGQIYAYAADGTRLFDTPFSGTFVTGTPSAITFAIPVPEPIGLSSLAAGGWLFLRRSRPRK